MTAASRTKRFPQVLRGAARIFRGEIFSPLPLFKIITPNSKFVIHFL
jgi:hypothetical protein